MIQTPTKTYFHSMKNILSLFFVLCLNNLYPQSVTGVSGDFTIPTAEILNDGELRFGSCFLPKDYMNGSEGNKYDGLLFAGSLGFLPNLEIGLRITYFIDRPDNYMGDRMLFVRYRILSEGEYLPAVVFGAHDFFGPAGGLKTLHFNSLYLTASKNIIDMFDLTDIRLTMGYGSDIIDAAGHQFIGLFGGIVFSPLDWSELMIEYDAERWNGGMRITLFEDVKLFAGFLEFKHLSGGISAGWSLR